MGVSLHYEVLRDPNNEVFKKHLEVNNACLKAGVANLSKETAEFLGFDYPEDSACVESEALGYGEVAIANAVSDVPIEYCQGYDIDITKLPPDAKIIRFYIS